ncbi:MAG TPA: hypothetical protein VF268_04550 [Gammaproteobacteria bacterium]
MNWLNRYITAVKNYLPGNMRDDVGQELLSLLQDKIEAAEEGKGRPLTEEEQLALLKQMGHPVKVAAGFHKRQTLIGEESFPFYKQTLKYAWLGVFVVYFILAALSMTTAPDFKFSREINRALPDMFNAMIYAFAIVTLIFYAGDRVLKRRDFFGNWEPRNLPKTENQWVPIPLYETIPAIIFTVIFLAFINALVSSVGVDSDSGGNGLAFSESVAGLLPYINVTILFSLGLMVYNLFTPYWTAAKLIGNVAIGIAACAILSILLGLDSIIVIRGSATALAPFYPSLHTLIKTVLAIVLLVNVYEILRDAYRAWKLGKR